MQRAILYAMQQQQRWEQGDGFERGPHRNGDCVLANTVQQWACKAVWHVVAALTAIVQDARAPPLPS